MSQDNNEAASALRSAIMNLPCNPPDGWGGIQQTGYKLGHRDARHAAAELVSASASQSSTAGDKVDEITERIRLSSSSYTGKGKIQLHHEVEHLLGHIALLKSHLAHVARQRQESEVYGYHYEWAGCITTEGPQHFKWEFSKEPPPDWAIESGQARNVQALARIATPSAAVAEGVDTALPEPTIEGSVMHPELKICYRAPVHYTAEQMTTYGAQQREAERRRQMERIRLIEGQRDIAQATCREFSKALDEAELARQPVSEGLTALHKLCEQITNMKRTKFLMPGTGQNYSYLLWEDVIFHVEEARATLFAAPPAKAEGLTDSARLDFMASENCRVEVVAGPDAPRYRVHWPDEGEWITECDRTPREAIDRAILAQQAKKGGA